MTKHLNQTALLLALCAATQAQVSVTPGSPTLNPSNLQITYIVQQASDIRLVIGRTTASPCVIGIQGEQIAIYPGVNAWYPSASGYIGSGLLSSSACSVNLGLSSYSFSNGWVTNVTTTLNIQIAGSLSQAAMDVSYLYTTYDNNGELNQYERTDAVGTWNVTGNTAIPGLLTYPTPATVIQSPNVTFSWAPANFPAQYEVWVGTAQGAGNIGTSGLINQTQTTLTGLPLGSTLHVTLYTYPLGGGAPHIRYYSTLTQSPAQVAQITAPTNNTVLPATPVTFQWSAGQGNTLYRFMAGTAPGNGDILDQFTAGLSVTAAIPATGQSVYVTLTSYAPSSQQSRSYTYRAASPAAPPRPAAIISPAPSGILPLGNVTFAWDAGIGVQSFRLAIGRSPEGSDLYLANLATTSAVVTNIPQTGVAIHVTLWSLIGTTLQKNSYMYLAPSAVAPTVPASTPAVLISPTAGSVLGDSTATFQWTTGQGADAYHFCVGTAPLGCTLASSGTLWANVYTAFGLPTNGSSLYATLWSRINGVWLVSTSIGVTARIQPPPPDPAYPAQPNWNLPLMSGDEQSSFKSFSDGFDQYTGWTPSPFGMSRSTSQTLPLDLVIPRGRRYVSTTGAAASTTSPGGSSASAVFGGGECVFMGEGEPCPPSHDVNSGVAYRDPHQAIRSLKYRMNGFRFKGSFQDLPNGTNPLREIPPEVIVSRDFTAIQAVYFHQQPVYAGGNEYGFSYDARSGELGLYASINTNITTGPPEGQVRGIGVGIDSIVTDGSISALLAQNATLYFAAWVVKVAPPNRVLCFQIGELGLDGSFVPKMNAWCKNAQQIYELSFAGVANFDSTAQVETMLREVATADGYITATNAYYPSSVKTTPNSTLSFWQQFWTFTYDLPLSFKLKVDQILTSTQ